MIDIENQVAKAVMWHIPNSTVHRVIDKGTLLKHTFQVELGSGRVLFLKMVTGDGDVGDLIHIDTVTRLFISHGLPAPGIVAIDDSCDILPNPYMIQEQIEGKKLLNLLEREKASEVQAMYEAVGRFYRALHSIKNDRSGLFRHDPKQLLYPITPTDYMFRAEIVNGSGKKAETEGRITRQTHNRLISTWQKNIDYLKEHVSSLIHMSPFPWNIYLTKDGPGWKVSKVMAMGDVLWWDPAMDLSMLQYPPFGQRREENWRAFASGYGPLPERKRILLYVLLELLCAAMGVYMQPAAEGNAAWAARALASLDSLMDEIEDIG